MLRRIMLMGLLLSSWVCAAVPPGPAVPEQPSAEEIVARNVAARGGLEAWRAIHAMFWAGHVEGAGPQAGSVRFVLEQARPNRTRFGVNVAGEESLRVFDGERGWKLRPKPGIRPDVQTFSPEEVRFAKDAEVIDGPLIDYAAHGSTIALGGREEVDGHQAWRIDVMRPGGAHEAVWVDASTFLDVRYDRTSYKPKGEEVRISVHYRDFRVFDGVRIPTVLDLGGSAGASSSRMVIEQVLLNPDLDEFAFADPRKLHLQSRPRAASGQPEHAPRPAGEASAAPGPAVPAGASTVAQPTAMQ